MDGVTKTQITQSSYDRDACATGIVHLGFGAFHRAHQAVYIDDYMAKTGDLAWGIAAVNLRGAESDSFAEVAREITHHGGYFLKAISPANATDYHKIRPHIAFSDWAAAPQEAEELVSLASVKLITITVTESGYYTDPKGLLDRNHPVIASELQTDSKQSVYAYLRAALAMRKQAIGEPITISCCDNIRQNGKMLERNMMAYLDAFGDGDLMQWVKENVSFPCSMVDRITPRSPDSLRAEMTAMIGEEIVSPILCEDYIQWVLADNAASVMPDLAQVGVTVTSDVDPYEETKIRVLNGGHTSLAYMAALKGIETFDAAMEDSELRAHFDGFETEEVLPAITIALPFAKDAYQTKTAMRFSNQAIGDTVARICADGMAKFPIFIRPTLAGCFAQNIVPHYAIGSIASWYVFARHVQAGNIAFDYIEPSWDALEAMLGDHSFFTSEQLWGTIPQDYPEFIELLQRAVAELEEKMAGLTLRDVRKSYEAAEVIHGVDLDIKDGEFVVFVGPSGCGKSTLLRMIAGLEEISGGSISIGDTEVNEVAASKRGVAMVFQTYALYPHMTVYKNMAFGLKQAKTPADEIDRRVRAAADILQITDYLDRSPRHLSGGQRQRVAIGRAIVRDPKVFLFDEPLSNLDAALRVQTRLEIARLHERLKTTMIYVTHDQVEAMTLADKIVVLRDGIIEQVGSPIDLYERPANAFVAQFIGSPKMNFFEGADLAKNAAKQLGKTIDESMQLGMRPEHLIVTTAAKSVVTGTLELVENLGEVALVHLVTASGTQFIAKTEKPPKVKKGEVMHFTIDPSLAHYFAKDTGLAL